MSEGEQFFGVIVATFEAYFGERKVADLWSEDGVAPARRVWALSLQRFDAVDITQALIAVGDSGAEFPPGLPAFLVHAREARRRRQAAQEPASTPVLAGPIRSKRVAELVAATRKIKTETPLEWAQKIADGRRPRAGLYALSRAREIIAASEKPEVDS